MEKKEQRHTHSSFGQISFSRVNGTSTFYGSELKQDNYIEMTVNKSEIVRDLTQDRYYNYGAPLIRVRMSANQFSELITSINSGNGTCCTVEMVDGKSMDKFPAVESRKEFVHRSFEDRMRDFAQSIQEHQQQALGLVKKKTLSDDDVRDITYHLERLNSEIANNIPFFARYIQETMDTVVQKAMLAAETYKTI